MIKIKLYAILAIFLVGINYLSGIEAKNNNTQKKDRILGYGPIGGDLILPRSSIIYEEKLFVLDQYGLSLFDANNHQFIKRFKVDQKKEDSLFWENPNNWTDLYLSLSYIPPFFLKNSYGYREAKNVFVSDSFFRNEMSIDNANNLYILRKNEFLVFNMLSEVFTRSIIIPDEITYKTLNNIFYFTFHIYQDKIFLLKTTTDSISYVLSNEIFILSLDGNIQKRIVLDLPSDVKYWTVYPDFIFIEKDNLFCLIQAKDSLTSNPWKSFSPILFYNEEGKLLKNNDLQYAIVPSGIEYIEPDKIVIFGISSIKNEITSYSYCLIQIRFSISLDREVSISIENYKSSRDFGIDCLDLYAYKNKISLITSGKYESIWDFKTFFIEDESIIQIGSEGNLPGQMNASFAFSIDKVNGYLFETSLNSNKMNRFNEFGVIKNQILFDLEKMSIEDNTTLVRPIVSNILCVDNETIVLTNFDPGNISQYSLKNQKWETIFRTSGRINDYLWIDIQYYQETIFLLDLKTNKDQCPILYRIEPQDNELRILSNFTELKKKFSKPPLFLGFSISDIEYQFLDCVHQSVWIYDYKKKLKEIVQLPQDEKSFYSSFDLYPDGSWIVTDVTQHRLLHVARSGELLETIGSKGQVEIGTTKEAYQEKSDQFYFPIRAKIANNHIYVSDFGNCRYHVIPIEPLTINWQENSIQHENVSIFSSESGTLHYEISTPSILSYQVTSSVPWLTIQHPTGSLSDKQIEYQILGDKLTPWQTHQGVIQITFPEQWSFLNKTIPVTVTAIGSTVELTIGSNIAKVDSKWITLESGYVPVIKQGRTCIGLRFLTEYLFRSHASIEYEASLQRIKVTTQDHSIYMIIQHPIASVDGKPVSLDVPPFIQQGRTMIPLRFVSESLEAEVSWEASTQKVTISYPRREK